MRPNNKPKLIVVRRVQGGSMSPKLKNKQLVIAVLAYKPKINRVYIIKHDSLELIKRLQKLTMSGAYFVGDNLAYSSDSRQFGFISLDDVYYRLIWPII